MRLASWSKASVAALVIGCGAAYFAIPARAQIPSFYSGAGANPIPSFYSGAGANPIPNFYNVNPIPNYYNVNPNPNYYNVNPIPNYYNVNPIPNYYNVNPIPNYYSGARMYPSYRRPASPSRSRNRRR